MVDTGAQPMSFCWDAQTLGERAIVLVRSMAAVKCKNKYPVGVIGRVARDHYDEARRIAQAIEAGTAMTEGHGPKDESAVATPCAQSQSEAP